MTELTGNRYPRQFLKFILVSVVNTVFGYLVFALSILIGFHYLFAAMMTTVLGVLFNFQTTGRLVFGSSDNSLIFRFTGSYALSYLLLVAGLAFFNSLGINSYLAGAVLTVPVGIFTYLLQKRYVFVK